MPIRVYWGSEAKTFVIFEFIGKWTWDEYYEGRSTGIKLGNEVPYVVNLIVDYSQSGFFPSNMLSHFGSSIDRNPKEFDVAVIVTQSPFAIALLNVLSKVKKSSKFRVAKTRDEAFKMMADVDAQRGVNFQAES
jgi:hypothetical protein